MSYSEFKKSLEADIKRARKSGFPEFVLSVIERELKRAKFTYQYTKPENEKDKEMRKVAYNQAYRILTTAMRYLNRLVLTYENQGK